MKKILLLITLFSVFAAARAQDSLRPLVFAAVLDTTLTDSLNSQSSGSGIAAFLWHNDSLQFDITVNGISGNLTGVRIHSENDSILAGMDAFIDRNSVRGTFENRGLNDNLMLQLLSGTAWLVVNTTGDPDGGLRGRIHLETGINYGAFLDPEQAGITDSFDTIPVGLSTFNLGADSMMLEVNVMVSNLTSPVTNAHLHYGAPGQTGPPVVPLMPYFTGQRFTGMVNLDSLPDREAFLDSLNAGLVYVNVHTENYPGGEVRGQLARHDALAFDSWMDVMQVTDSLNAATPDSAMGLTHMYINASMDTLWVHMLVDSLSGPITGSHFHLGPPGMPGPARRSPVPISIMPLPGRTAL